MQSEKPTREERKAELTAKWRTPHGPEDLTEHLRKLKNVPEGNPLPLIGIPVIQEILKLEFGPE